MSTLSHNTATSSIARFFVFTAMNIQVVLWVLTYNIINTQCDNPEDSDFNPPSTVETLRAESGDPARVA
jgi:hypothetical protein